MQFPNFFLDDTVYFFLLGHFKMSTFDELVFLPCNRFATIHFCLVLSRFFGYLRSYTPKLYETFLVFLENAQKSS